MKKTIHTDKAPKAVGPYSQAIEVNGTLYISGQIPINPATGAVVEGGIVEQTEQVFRNIKAILSEAGYTPEHVVKTTVLMQDLNDFAAMNEVYAQHFTAQQPARSTFQVAKLPLGVQIEIETVAVR
ncbi:MAG: RidA family protein [Prevotellaceae bacterium]|jgi:2-iminobutanoate/2-iminopropanoate deaminase|nr:RidA family protein [Prevotellaceae bacterium]